LLRKHKQSVVLTVCSQYYYNNVTQAEQSVHVGFDVVAFCVWNGSLTYDKVES